ncbi:MAG: hypothetical protein HYW23_03985 [Candidatus Aenigmarchaeota archaeon]|nr:hypothetical protein [Candidatus Aenigmarchaeota archaeon]
MFKSLLRAFLDGVIASFLFYIIGGILVSFMGSLPYLIANSLVFGVLVLIVDYILQNIAHL